MAEEKPTEESTESFVKEEEYEEVAGLRIGHGGFPLFLVIVWLIAIIWAIVSWVNPPGK